MRHSRVTVLSVADGKQANFSELGLRARFSGDGKSIYYIDPITLNIVKQAFPSSPGSPRTIAQHVAPEVGVETFHVSPDDKLIVLSIPDPSQSLMLAEGVIGIDPPKRTKPN